MMAIKSIKYHNNLNEPFTHLVITVKDSHGNMVRPTEEYNIKHKEFEKNLKAA